ncbi:MAG: lipid-binding SYLF domain-containing protein [Terriglobia bacterium]
MRSFNTILLILALLTSWAVATCEAQSKEAERLKNSATVMNEIMAAPDKSIPTDLLVKCACVAVIPSMKKGGFIFGGRYGRGAVSCRKKGGTGDWGPPSMIELTGGSFGLQAGGAAVDVVLLIMELNGINSLIKNKFTLGGDASAAAGPVGRSSSAETDAYMKAKILSYSRSQGIFAGVELKGAVLKQDRDGNQRLYGKIVGAKDLLFDATEPIPKDAQPFIQTLEKYSPVRNRRTD